MEREELKNKISEVIKKSRMGSMATIRDGKPWVRYMMLQQDENLNCYASTFAGSRKVEQIRKNNNVHIAVGGDANNTQAAYVNIQATAQVLTDLETKKKYWSDMLKQFFSGPEDPNYAVIKISPQVIEYTSSGAHPPEIYVVDETQPSR